MSIRLAVCISGRGSNLDALADALAGDPRGEVALVLSDRADAPGLLRAGARGTAAAALADWRDPAEWLRHLEGHGIGLIVLAGFLVLVPAGVVARYRGRIANVHPSLLPDFGGPGMYGRRVHEAVLASGAQESGATVHLVDEEYDRGAILGQARVPVLPGDTPAILAARVLAEEHRLLPAVVSAALDAGRFVPLPSATSVG